MQEFLTACPRNCYSTCSFRVQVEDNRIRRVLPYEKNLATPEGPCIKGLSYIERSHSPSRLLHPLLRRPDGSFTQISLKEALGIVADRLNNIRQRYGSQSILWYRGSGMSGLTNEIGHSFWKSFGGVTTTYGNLCWPAGLEAVRLTLGSVKHNVPWDIENAGLLIIWGKNPAETNIHEMAFIGKAREHGARIIVIDPVRTPTADKADVFISPVPGSDGALALAIAGLLIRNSRVDSDFIKSHVKGFEEFKNSLDLTPEKASKITGVPEAVIHELAGLIGTIKPVTVIPGYGLQRHAGGGQTIRALLSLVILTGNLGKPGSGFNYANLQSFIYDDPKEPVSYYPDPANDKPFRRSVSMVRLGRDILDQRDPEIRAVWIERGNPVLQSPESRMVVKAFTGLDFRVVVDQFMTDTARMADIIFPSKDLFEQTDIIGSYWSPYIQLKPKILESPGDVIPESEIWYHLGRAMGLEQEAGHVPGPGNENIEAWLDRRISGNYSISLDDLRSGPVIPPGLQMIAWSDYKFDTPSGKIELYSEETERRWGISPLPAFKETKEVASREKYPLFFLTPNSASRIHSQFGNLNIISNTFERPSLLISQADASERKISDGHRIRVFNETGWIITRATISNRIPRGCVILPNGVWLDEGGGGNFLVGTTGTDMGFGAAFHDTLVEVEKAYNDSERFHI